MTITFTTISQRSIPEIQIELNLQAAASLQAQQAYKDVWIFAERISTGTSTDNEVRAVPFSSATEAAQWFGLDSDGAPSLGAAMAAMYMSGKSSIGRPKSQCWGVALPEPSAGAAASQTLTLSGTATSSGTWILEIGAQRFSVGVAAGDDEDALGAAIVAAYQALPLERRPPVGASYNPATKIVTFTATNKGAAGNQIGCYTYQDPSCGITATWGGSALAGGSGYPTVTTALGNILAVQTPILAVPWDAAGAATVLEDIVDHVNAKAAAGSELTCRLFCADKASAASAASAADALDDDDGERVIYIVAPPGHAPFPGHLVAAVAAADASETHLARSLDGVGLQGFEPWPESENFSKVEADTLVKAGCTPLRIPTGGDQVQIVRLMADRTNLSGQVVELDGAIMSNLDYCRDYVRSVLASKYQRMSIVEGEIKTMASHVTTVTSVKATFYEALKDLEGEAHLVDVDDHWESAQVEFTNGRILAQIPVEMVPQWHSTYVRMDATV